MLYRFYWLLFIIFGVLLPINAPIEYWDESFINSWLIIGCARLIIATHISWLVNSAVLVWGLKKGDKLIFYFVNTRDTISLIYKLLYNMPKSHGTVLIDEDGIYVFH